MLGGRRLSLLARFGMQPPAACCSQVGTSVKVAPPARSASAALSNHAHASPPETLLAGPLSDLPVGLLCSKPRHVYASHLLQGKNLFSQPSHATRSSACPRRRRVALEPLSDLPTSGRLAARVPCSLSSLSSLHKRRHSLVARSQISTHYESTKLSHSCCSAAAGPRPLPCKCNRTCRSTTKSDPSIPFPKDLTPASLLTTMWAGIPARRSSSKDKCDTRFSPRTTTDSLSNLILWHVITRRGFQSCASSTPCTPLCAHLDRPRRLLTLLKRSW